MGIPRRNDVRVIGQGRGRTTILAHGVGCDRDLWRLLTPGPARHSRVTLSDHVVSGRSGPAARQEEHHTAPDGYARDVVDGGGQPDPRDAVFAGHPVGAMAGVPAAAAVPDRPGSPVVVCPSPSRIDEEDHRDRLFTSAATGHRRQPSVPRATARATTARVEEPG
ncbi:hypothetical protein ACWC4J_14480 [Streptomyces sp. NPDC001356]